MSPEIWGKYGWAFIHLVTYGYPKEPTQQDKENYYRYFTSLQHVLPCGKCRKNMGEHLAKLPINDDVLRDRESMIKWGIDLHNIVNHYTGKPMLSYSDAKQSIEKMMHPKNKTSIWVYLLIIAAALIIIYLLYLIISQK